jgi:hypothetical protein
VSEHYTDIELELIAATSDGEAIEGSIARKLVLEIKERRAAQSASAERVRAVVREEMKSYGTNGFKRATVENVVCAIADRVVADMDSESDAAMMLLDGLTGRRSSNVFEAARAVEAVIAGIPGRPIVQEPSARGRALHDAADSLSASFMAGAAYAYDHSEVDDDGRVTLEPQASVERAAEQYVRDHEVASNLTQAVDRSQDVTDHEQSASAERVRSVVREAVSAVMGVSWGNDAIADIVVEKLAAPAVGLDSTDRILLRHLRNDVRDAEAEAAKWHAISDQQLASAQGELLDRLLGAKP